MHSETLTEQQSNSDGTGRYQQALSSETGTEQVTCSIREAADRLGISPKKVRRLVKAGRIRATLKQGRWGPEWRLEVATLPPSPAGAEGGGGRLTRDRDTWPPGFDVGELLRKWEGALVRVGQLENERERRLALEADAASLRTRAIRADGLAGDLVKMERENRRLRWERAALIVAALLFGILAVVICFSQ